MMNDITGERVGERGAPFLECAIGPHPMTDGIDRCQGAGAVLSPSGQQNDTGTYAGAGTRDQRAPEQFRRGLGQPHRVFVLGASGFIGRRVVRLLAAHGCQVVAGVRRPETASALPVSEVYAIDFSAMLSTETWLPFLAGIDTVVNLVGIFDESVGKNTFVNVQHKAAASLFQACSRIGIRRVIQLSALGADASADTPFLLTKHAADEALLACDVPEGLVLQPSLVYGSDGRSSVLFRALASLPLIVLPSGGRQLVQPIHVDDVAAAIVTAVRDLPLTGVVGPGRRVPLVGPAPVSLARYLALLRMGMGRGGRLMVVSIPQTVAMHAAGWLGRRINLPLNADAMRMLARGNTASAAAITALLGHPPRPPEEFIAESERLVLWIGALLTWMPWVLRASVAFLWIATAIVSFGWYPITDSLALLGRAGVPETMRPIALYGAATLDLIMGVLSVSPRRPTWLWHAQAALIIGYMLVITVRLPEYWLHPYGPITKNVPILALIWLLDLLERRRPWTTSR